MEFTKVLLHKNQNLIDNEINQQQHIIKYFQGYIDKVVALGFKVNDNDLEPLFENPKAYITAKITDGQNLQVGGLTLNKEKLFDLIEKPEGTNEFIESVTKDLSKNDILEHYIFRAHRFSVSNNKVVLKKEILEEIDNRHSIFIQSENQQNGYNKIVELAKLVNEINLLANTKIGTGTTLSQLLVIKDNLFEAGATSVKIF